MDGYKEHGGQHINVNVIDREMLLDAMEQPEKYPQLTIRFLGARLGSIGIGFAGGIILDGEVEIVRGLYGSTQHYAVLGPGEMISEDAFLGDVAHTSGALTRQGATVWQISMDQIDTFRAGKPDLFYRIVARVAAGISERLRVVSQSMAHVESPVHLKGAVRLEHDSLGEREIPQ